MAQKADTHQTIVACALELFLDRGLVAVSMEELAEKVQCTRRTLYRHFAKKEDLVLSVVILLLDNWNSAQREIFSRLRGTGAEKLAAFLRALVDFMQGQKQVLRFMGEYDFVFQDSNNYKPEPENSEKFKKVIHVTEEILEEILREGVADKSLELFTSEELIIPTITTVLWTLGQRIAFRDRLLREEFGISGLDMVNTQIDFILRALEPAALARSGSNVAVSQGKNNEGL